MSASPREKYLRDALRALVTFFGGEEVRRALAELSSDEPPIGSAPHQRRSSRVRAASGRSRKAAMLPRAVLKLQATEPQKYELLAPFLQRIHEGDLLRHVLQHRRFAEDLGIKHPVSGSRRSEITSYVARHMADKSLDEITKLIARAESISREPPDEDFALLTDKLMEKGH